MNVRSLVLGGLLAVERGRHSDAVVDGLGRRLEGADRRLATELLYGTLRWRLRLDHTLAALARRDLLAADPAAAWGLRLGAYQVLFTNIPAHAALDETVEAVKVRNRRAAPFVNAVLRALVANGEVPPPTDPVAALAVTGAHPEWLVRRWWHRFGEEGARALVAADNERPPLVLRANEARIDRAGLLERLRAAGLDAWPTERSDLGVGLPGGKPTELPGWAEGLFQVQGSGAQAAVLAVRAPAGAEVADVCAGMGTKSLALLARPFRPRVHAFDLRPERLRRMAGEARRLGLPMPPTAALDAADPPQALSGRFAAVLVDAPCSALGLLARHPEIRWRRAEADIARAAAGERRILAGAARLVAPGGVLVYSVCTVEREETVDVVRWLLARGGFRLDEAFGEGGQLVLLPKAGEEGFFVARFLRD